MRYDVIVVGAGPAGSTTARECAGRGLSVLMLDKAEFPRDKPCGGGVTVRAAKLLPLDFSDVIERVAVGMRLTCRGSHVLTRYSEEDLVYFTQRRRLDAFLAERAAASGSNFRQRCAVRAVERDSSGVGVFTDEGAFHGDALVVADGANGRTAEMAGIHVGATRSIALEGNITPPGGVPAEWSDVFGLDIGSPPGGYGWAFPKGDHLNI
ncbi:MAG: FAD-dependent oxidoreductase, partial [Acidobacteriota bacterium]